MENRPMDRPDPDDLLRRIKEESREGERGHLKIFFGYAAGVGKTYTMLKAARAAQKRGVDVVAGYVEPHNRPDTQRLLEGLEQLPFLQLDHKGITVREFDLDGAVKRHPQLILVDELAHTNGEGCRHEKRYQDVEELLRQGIDVFTTVNVQHIESLTDIVASITGVVVRERIPDRVFDDADQVSVVDIEPEELLQRLEDGKVYGENQAKRATEHFFTVENLVALREIALRRTADRINKMADRVKQAQGSEYYTDENILVCLSPSPANSRIIRTAARMAAAFKGEFTALFVETPDFAQMSEADKSRLRHHIHLAQQLGATVETVYGENIALQISEFARMSGVSKIVAGRSSVRRRLWGRPSLTEQLIAYAPNLDVYIIPDVSAADYRQKFRHRHVSGNIGADIFLSFGILLLCTVVGFIFSHFHFSEVNTVTVYILGVLATAVITSYRSCSLIMSIVSVLTFNFFFTDPRFTFTVYDSGYPVTFVVMFAAAFLTGSLASKIKTQATMSAKMAYRTKILLETNQLLGQAKGRDGIISVTGHQLNKLLNRDVIFYPAEDGKQGDPVLFLQEEGTPQEALLSPKERAVADWVMKNGKHAGATTGTLGNAKCLYLAVRISGRIYGVVGIHMEEEPPDAFVNNIVLSVLGECALAMDQWRADMESREAAALAKNEQLRANLLRTISHDLRTPLTSISGNAGILLSSEASIDSAGRHKLYQGIYDDSMWLFNLVENLLSVTRIQDGTMALRMSAELLDDVVMEALRHLDRHREEHTIAFVPTEDYLVAKMDARLIVQVIVNIVDNGVKYTPVGSEIKIQVRKEGAFGVISVSDNGEGISQEAKAHIFDMFYTGGVHVADSRRSMGLGLALCKSIVTAHGGEIRVKDNDPKGSVFEFTLPLQEVNMDE